MPYSVGNPLQSPAEGMWVTGISVTHSPCDLVRVDVELMAKDMPTVEAVLGCIYGAWRECEESLPPDDCPVLVCREDDVGVASYWGDGEWSVFPSPTHWQSLPSPAPKAKKTRKK